MQERRELLSVQNLSVGFRRYTRGFSRSVLHAIRDLSVAVHAGELVAVVGSSGSGKSLLAHSIFDLLPYNARMEGRISYRGEELTMERRKALCGSEIVLVPQSVNYLDPLMRIGPQLRRGRRDAGSRAKTAEVLRRFGLGEEVERQYPFELSGGMARRVLIASAVQEAPRLVIADEPTPGLHLRIARRVLGHFREVAAGGAGVLLITHDLELALEVADRIVVFYAGTMVEDAPAEDFAAVERLRHPYTQALWRAIPDNGFEAIPGTQPYAGKMPDGCPFQPRCGHAQEACGGAVPWRAVRGGFVRCLRGEGVEA